MKQLLYSFTQGNGQKCKIFLDKEGFVFSIKEKSQRLSLAELFTKIEDDREFHRFALNFCNIVPQAYCAECEIITQAEMSRRNDLRDRALYSKKWPDVHLRNSLGETPLMRAAFTGEGRAVKYLLEKKADINSVDDNGHSALSLAMQKGAVAYYDTIMCLIENKADVNVLSADEELDAEPVLIKMIQKKRFFLISKILEYGANVNYVTKQSGKNALHCMCASRSLPKAFQPEKLSVIQELLLMGANYELIDEKDHKKPLDLLTPTEKDAIDSFIKSETEKAQNFLPEILVTILGRGYISSIILLITGYFSAFASQLKPALETTSPIQCPSTDIPSLVSHSAVVGRSASKQHKQTTSTCMTLVSK